MNSLLLLHMKDNKKTAVEKNDENGEAIRKGLFSRLFGRRDKK